MNTIEKTVLQFLQRNACEGKKILLGLSGGPDSLALLYALLESQKKISFQFAIAHIDHGWRVESTHEAELLSHLAEQLDLSFYLYKIPKESLVGNLEEACRCERLRFFKQLCQRHGYHGVLLGHHADDQTETVLKRILEGSSLVHCSGLMENILIDDLLILRPLLSVNKLKIYEYLKKKNLHAFTDPTNLDPKFLRAKMRTKIIPALEQHFGKNVSKNLCRFAEDVKDLHLCLQDMVSAHISRTIYGAMGAYLDLSDLPVSNYVVRLIIKEFCSQNHFTIAREQVDSVCQLLRSGSANKRISAGHRTLVIDRKKLFLLSKEIESEPTVLPLELGVHCFGPWQVSVTLHDAERPTTGWQEVWQGAVHVCLPVGNYVLRHAKRNSGVIGRSSTMDKIWTTQKVPSFMRTAIPVIFSGDRICHEFLSKKNYSLNKNSTSIKVSMKLIN